MYLYTVVYTLDSVWLINNRSKHLKFVLPIRSIHYPKAADNHTVAHSARGSDRVSAGAGIHMSTADPSCLKCKCWRWYSHEYC